MSREICRTGPEGCHHSSGVGKVYEVHLCEKPIGHTGGHRCADQLYWWQARRFDGTLVPEPETTKPNYRLVGEP